jgi:hypothetical protein
LFFLWKCPCLFGHHVIDVFVPQAFNCMTK